MRKAFCIVLILIIIFSFCGCSIYSEGESKYIVSFIGFDKKDKINVCIEAISGSDITSTDSSKYVFKASGATPKQAMYALGEKLSKPLLLDHCAVVAFGDTLDITDISRVLEFCRDEKGLNLAVFLVSSPDTQKLTDGKLSGYDIMGLIERTSKHTGVVFGNRFYEIEAKVTRKKPSFSLPIIVLDESGFKLSGEKIYKENRPVLTLSNSESRTYSLLCNSNSGGKISINGSFAKIKSCHTAFNARLKNDSLKIALNTTLKGNGSDEFNIAFVEDCKALINKAKVCGAGDIFGFADNIFRRNSSLWDEIKSDYDKLFSHCDIEISVSGGESDA